MTTTILVAGERVEVPGAGRIVTFKDPGEGQNWTFYRTGVDSVRGLVRQLTSRRHVPEKMTRVVTRKELEETVTQVVLHTDCTVTSKICYNTLVNRGLSTHFMIDWDGTIYQGADIIDRTYHAGEANNRSIGVDLNNRLPLLQPGDSENYSSHFTASNLPDGFRDQERQVAKGLIGNTVKKSFGYTDEQYLSLIALLNVLRVIVPGICSASGYPEPPMDAQGQVIRTVVPGGAPQSGLVAHWHLSAMKWDPGPGFDWERVYYSLRGEFNHFPIQLSEENQKPLTSSEMEDMAAAYYTNTDGGLGGYYPIGINQSWHGGVHLHSDAGSPVSAMLTGQLVAARMLDGNLPLGSGNFVLLRHRIPMPRLDADDAEIIFYSLYMHLQPLGFDAESRETWPEWMRDARARAVKSGEIGLTDDGDSTVRKRALERPYPEFGSEFKALASGQVAYWKTDIEEPIQVVGGSVLGQMGVFGDERDQGPLVHVEIFADASWKKAIDLAVHARFWFPIEENEPGDLLVRNEALLDMVAQRRAGRGRANGLFPFEQGRLRPKKIRRFYKSGGTTAEAGRAYLRRAIVRSTSEWSDRVEWLKPLVEAQDWTNTQRALKAKLTAPGAEDSERLGLFRQQIRSILPYTWLTEEVAKAIGLEFGEWDGMVYHFHPIHFLVWISFYSSARVRVVSKGLTRKELLEKAKEEQERLELQRRRFEDGFDIAANIEDENLEEFLEESLERDLTVEIPNPTRSLQRLRSAERAYQGSTWDTRKIERAIKEANEAPPPEPEPKRE